MVKLDKLILLEKVSSVNLSQCNIIENWYEEEKGIRTRILENGGRYFLHTATDNGTVSCMEIAIDWQPWEHRIIFAWTPDDRHIHRIESGLARPIYEILQLSLDQIQPGDSCTYKGMEVTYVDPNHIRLNDKTVKVVQDSTWTYAARHNFILAQNGAAGFFRFMEQMAEEYNRYHILPVYCGLWEGFFERYKAIREEVEAA